VSTTFFGGRPRFFAEPPLVTDTFGLDADFFLLADPDGRPRFFFDDVSFDTDTTGFFGDDVLEGRPRFLFSGS
jgi:hypothetical protein